VTHIHELKAGGKAACSTLLVVGTARRQGGAFSGAGFAART